jgi:hypothetical protein
LQNYLWDTNKRQGTTLQAAKKLQMDGERANFEECKTINHPSRIVLRAFWRYPFFALFEKLSFSAAC